MASCEGGSGASGGGSGGGGGGGGGGGSSSKTSATGSGGVEIVGSVGSASGGSTAHHLLLPRKASGGINVSHGAVVNLILGPPPGSAVSAVAGRYLFISPF